MQLLAMYPKGSKYLITMKLAQTLGYNYHYPSTKYQIIVYLDPWGLEALAYRVSGFRGFSQKGLGFRGEGGGSE